MEENGGGKHENGGRVLIFDKYSTPDGTDAVPAKPLTKQDLINYFVSGFKPKDQWRYFYLFIFKFLKTYYFIIHMQ